MRPAEASATTVARRAWGVNLYDSAGARWGEASHAVGGHIRLGLARAARGGDLQALPHNQGRNGALPRAAYLDFDQLRRAARILKTVCLASVYPREITRFFESLIVRGGCIGCR